MSGFGKRDLIAQKTKLKLRLQIPVTVNPVLKSFLTAPFPWETFKKRYRSDKLLASFSMKTLKSLQMKEHCLTLTLANGCNPTTSFAHASSNDIHRHDE